MLGFGDSISSKFLWDNVGNGCIKIEFFFLNGKKKIKFYSIV
jgi:hypothetical protein